MLSLMLFIVLVPLAQLLLVQLQAYAAAVQGVAGRGAAIHK